MARPALRDHRTECSHHRNIELSAATTAERGDFALSWPETPAPIGGARGQNRTDDLLFTRQLLCQLSYSGKRVDD